MSEIVVVSDMLMGIFEDRVLKDVLKYDHSKTIQHNIWEIDIYELGLVSCTRY